MKCHEEVNFMRITHVVNMKGVMDLMLNYIK